MISKEKWKYCHIVKTVLLFVQLTIVSEKDNMGQVFSYDKIASFPVCLGAVESTPPPFLLKKCTESDPFLAGKCPRQFLFGNASGLVTRQD